MLCCVMLCCVVLCCVVLCCVVLCCVVLCCAVLCCVVLCCAVLCCVVLCCVVLCCAVLCCVVLSCVVWCCVVLCCVVLSCLVLCGVVLCCAVLCCSVYVAIRRHLYRDNPYYTRREIMGNPPWNITNQISHKIDDELGGAPEEITWWDVLQERSRAGRCSRRDHVVGSAPGEITSWEVLQERNQERFVKHVPLSLLASRFFFHCFSPTILLPNSLSLFRFFFPLIISYVGSFLCYSILILRMSYYHDFELTC